MLYNFIIQLYLRRKSFLKYKRKYMIYKKYIKKKN